MHPLRLTFTLLFCAACLQQVDIGEHRPLSECPAGQQMCPCEGCAPEGQDCPCPAAPDGCQYAQSASCVVCIEHLVCPQACGDVSCPTGSRCCPCNGCVDAGDECPFHPAWCDIDPSCRLEGSIVVDVCDCGRHICPGECDELPGGECDESTYCEFASNCNAQVGAMCEPRPPECSSECEEVCGCDGANYCNTCEARRNGIDVRNLGPC